jgi:hypothetical protein
MKSWAIGVIALGILSIAYASGANTCVALPPLKISGTLAGRVMDPTGAPIAQAELQVVDQKQKDMAEIQTDAKGEFNFEFSRLANGTYTIRIVSPVGFSEYIGQVQVGRSRFPFWKRGLILKAGVGSCSSSLGRKRFL